MTLLKVLKWEGAVKVNVAWVALLLVCAPSRAKRLSSEYTKYRNSSEAHAAMKAYEKEHPFPERSFDRIRSGLFWSLLLVLASAISAALIGRLYLSIFGTPSPVVLEIVQYVGIGVILWTTLAKQGWSIQSIDGGTLPELVDDFLFRLLYVVGSFLLALAISMQLAVA